MKSLVVLLTVCLGLASAHVARRQAGAVPPASTAPPMAATSTNAMPDPVMTTATNSSNNNNSNDTTPDATPVATNNSMTTQTVTGPPVVTTTKKPTIDEIVSVEEIVDVFKSVAESEFFRRLPYTQQLIVLEILAGGETGKMTPVLEQMETRMLLSFMYNLPFKYVDSLWRLIDLGYKREDLVA